MKRPDKIVKGSLVAAALVLPLAWPVAGGADGPRTRAADFIGLWGGVDADDGSSAQRAITCDEDRTCRILGSDQFFSFCDDHGGRGILDGTGTLEEGVIEVPDYTLICGDGTRIVLATTFSLDRRNGTLLEDFGPPPPEIQIYHRLSPRVESRR
jgi:hypothetical protein